ncbi:MAG: diguanylate cyclase [Reinekea sp.]
MDSKTERLNELKQHFGRRVHEQARSLVNSWSLLETVHWNLEWYNTLRQSSEKLGRIAARYDYAQLSIAANHLHTKLKAIEAGKTPRSSTLEELNDLVSEIAEACSRVNDNIPIKQIAASRKPVYLCANDEELKQTLQQQLEHFTVSVWSFSSFQELERSLFRRLPAALIVDIKFCGDGISGVRVIQEQIRAPIPAIFFSRSSPSIEQRLAVVRANGVAILEGQVDFGRLVEILTSLFSLRSEPPFRVLVVDDSKTQSLFAENVLNSAGIFTRSVSKPLEVLDEMAVFRPDAILMDFYMPDCVGPELAQVIRQQSRFDAIPILYLSSESDIERQLDAVRHGGDDFLTKPVTPKVLIATVLNRCRRYRGLREQLIRDSLTGLLDHNNTLEALGAAIESMQAQGKPLSFVMIDIDHFKSINDTYGHAMGDRVIHSLALYLRQRFRLSDSIGRYGGEEFAVVLSDADSDRSEKLLEEVRLGFQELVHHFGDQQIHVTFSCGVAGMLPGDNASTVAQRADTALYQAKSEGRNRVVVIG